MTKIVFIDTLADNIVLDCIEHDFNELGFDAHDLKKLYGVDVSLKTIQTGFRFYEAYPNTLVYHSGVGYNISESELILKFKQAYIEYHQQKIEDIKLATGL